jgi:multiple sugar transport system permease protein
VTLTQRLPKRTLRWSGPRSRSWFKTLTTGERVFLIGGLVPALAWLAFSQGYPLVYSLFVSFQNWSLASSDTPQGFIGLGNYFRVAADPQFQHGLLLSCFFVGGVVIELVLGFALAYCSLGERRSLQLIRTLLIIPMVIAPIAVGTLWRLLLDANSGLVNSLLSTVGLHGADWLGNQSSAIISVIAVDVWEWIPFSMIIYTAAMSGIDPALLESARLDGASPWRIIRHLLIPMLLPATLMICVFRVIDAFLVIDVVFSMTYGGPGFSTTTATLWTYNSGLKYFNMGEASAASWLMLVLCLVIATVLLGLRSRAERTSAGN